MPKRVHPPCRDLRAFMELLRARDLLVCIDEPVSVVMEISEIHRRVLQAGGPALLFRHPLLPDGSRAAFPVLVNLFGTVERIALGLGVETGGLRQLGTELAELRDPTPPDGLRDALRKVPLLLAAMRMRPRHLRPAPVHRHVLRGSDIDLHHLPFTSSWPGEPAPMVSWGLVITRPPEKTSTSSYNVGVYRLQVAGQRRLIARWLAHRGGAAHHRLWRARGEPMPVAIVVGADPATLLSAVMPLPENLSELHFSGLIRGERTRLSDCVSIPLKIPADAEFILEGLVSPDETLPEGPYGDHTGYYNSIEAFPMVDVQAVTHRPQPILLSTFTGRPPDEPSKLGEALNAVFLPLIIRQFPEIVDFWLPPEACSYRFAVVAINKRYPGQARRIMMGVWSMLPQFAYTKFIVVVDQDIDIRSWNDVIWAISTRSDPSRDTLLVTDTPIDHLDFASPRTGLGGKMGIDATRKIGTETEREWAEVLDPDPAAVAKVDQIWSRLGLFSGVT
ncbi:MAG: UbiD family decarboxylase [Hyphomicrobiaceae bacterium]|nr:UbiD family decarboxylase [Hyphomicrobiaceae bacterium]